MDKPKVLLVGWDGADWNVARPLMAAGKMPALRRLVESGVAGDLRTLEPMLSPLLWTSIATGKSAVHHGVHGFLEVHPLTGRVQPVRAGTRQCAAIWDILAAQGLRAHVIGWFATQGERIPGGGVVSNLFPVPTAGPGKEWPPSPAGAIWPESNAEELDVLRVSPEDIDGDTVGLFCPRWSEVDTAKDRRLGQLRVSLAEAFSVQAAVCHTLERGDWDFVGVYFRALDEISHVFMPFHPPRLPGIPEQEYELYREVLEATYRMHDLMLARLMALAGDAAHVVLVSDHGFLSDQRRPRYVPNVPAGITVWHREHGVLAARGPKLNAGASIHGAGLLDITPTLLHLFGLEVGADMEGRVLVEAFAQADPPRTIPTWEERVSRLPDLELSAAESARLVEQFAALGYVAKPSGDQAQDARTVRLDNEWALARSLMHGAQPAKALPHLESLVAALPERLDIRQLLAKCQTQLGRHRESAETLDGILEKAGNTPVAALLRAEIALGRRDIDECRRWLDQAGETLGEDPRFLRQLGYFRLHLRDWPGAELAFRRLEQVAPEDADAHLGLAISYFHQNHLNKAMESALRTTALDFNRPRAHFILGRALTRQRDLEKAEAALRTALKIRPTFPHARQLLAAICRVTGRTQEALQHQIALVGLQSRREQATAAAAQQPLEATARLGPQYPTVSASSPRLETASPPPAPAPAAADSSPHTFVVVSGLPRSGTSLLMQMLAFGGLPPMHDGVRAADEHNEEGYWEWEALKDLPENPGLLDQAFGRAVKVTSALIHALPNTRRYMVIWMSRPAEEIARSQQRMRLGREATAAELPPLVSLLSRHATATLAALRRQSLVEVLEVDYPTLVRDPGPAIAQIHEFLGAALLPTPERMRQAVRRELHHQRSPSASDPGSPA